ncbi:MDR family MFS transporter [Steroidobacter sp.]|uniref:MDR family MFS transporter n=1 Tax=Steroidobacter sp. TaxID=1978227 RepID=UPI001A4ECC6C|nr:MDR family MFS transporter [Steroidobacter sp.]MBL8269957.1 multidrug efflux MFS transporter [Steroidobacter sp.]
MTSAATTTGSVTESEPERADATAWLAVAAGTIGAFMATLDISIVNSSLPTIQGEIGASGTEGTWIATAYLVAEVVILPLAAWFERLLGLRTFLLTSTILFTGFSIMCGLSTSLAMMVVGRVGQGFTAGAMIPTAQTIIATRLPRSQQPIGMAMFGVTAILGPVLGPLIGGWLTENMSWHYAFFLNVPVGIALVMLLLLGLPHRPVNLQWLREADWLGILGLTAGLGGLTVMLEDGQAEQWFDSQLIVNMAILAAFGFALMFAGQLFAKRPVIKLRLLLDRQFGSVAVMGLVLGMVLYGTAYAIPQFLATVAGYNALQSGKIVLLSGVPSLLMMPLVPLLLKRLDIRLSVSLGLAIMSISSFAEISLTADSAGAAFVDSQLMRGVGTILSFVFLSQAAIQSVSRDEAADAAGLFSCARNLGGSLALAGIATIQDQRVALHAHRLQEFLPANSVDVQDYLAGAEHQFGGLSAALGGLMQDIQQQALVMTYNDIFWIMGIGTLLVLPLVFFLRPLPKNAAPSMAH